MTRDRSERGAVLVQVAIAILVLTAMATFVVDHGILWVSRGQAQNAADAGALSGAIARAYDELTDPPASNGKAFNSAMGAALANNVWTAAPTAQVSWACPAGVAGSCVRVDVYRNGEFGSTPLPTIFGKVLNISSQGVRATATARVATGNATNCMRPFAVADKWIDNVNPALNPKKFERWQTGGRQCGAAESEGRVCATEQRQRRHWLHACGGSRQRRSRLKTRQPESDRRQQRRAGLDSYPCDFPTAQAATFPAPTTTATRSSTALAIRSASASTFRPRTA